MSMELTDVLMESFALSLLPLLSSQNITCFPFRQ